MALSADRVIDDATLVRAVQAGDRAAFATLFERHYPAVRRTCARRLRNIGEADEIAQAAFVRAFERIDRCGGERRFGGWVQVIAYRLCLDAVRARQRTTPTEEPLPATASTSPSGPEETILRRETRGQLTGALAALPPRQREVVVARHLEGRGPGEIAAALGLSVGAVDSLLLRARRRLAVALHATGGEAGVASVPATTAVTVAAGTGAAGGPFRLARVLGRAWQSAAAQVSSTLGFAPGGSAPVHQAAAAAMAATAALLVPHAAATGAAQAGPAHRPPAIVAPESTGTAITVPRGHLPRAPGAPVPAATVPTMPAVPNMPTTPTMPTTPSMPPTTLPSAAVPPTATPTASVPPGRLPSVTLPPITLPPITLPAITLPPITLPPLPLLPVPKPPPAP